MPKYVGFIYQWVNTSNGKIYIGSHKGQIDDGYIGSGKRFINAYNQNPSVFERYILEFIYDEDDLLETETRYLQSVSLDIVKDDRFYNMNAVADGGFSPYWGYVNGRKTFEEKKGLFSRTKEEVQKHNQKIAGRGAKICKIKGVGIFALTPEQRLINGRKANENLSEAQRLARQANWKIYCDAASKAAREKGVYSFESAQARGLAGGAPGDTRSIDEWKKTVLERCNAIGYTFLEIKQIKGNRLRLAAANFQVTVQCSNPKHDPWSPNLRRFLKEERMCQRCNTSGTSNGNYKHGKNVS